MNKKNKVLLSTVGLVLLSGIAATSTTFAWFTTVRTASISFNDATVQSLDGNLTIAYKQSGNTGVTGALDAATNTVTVTGTNKVVTDISGDGLNFYKPVWANPLVTASVINTVGTADGYYIDFTVTVGRDNTAGGNGLNVYVGPGTEIVAKDALGDTVQQAKNDGAVAGARLAIINTGAVVHRMAQVAETTPEYLVAGTTGVYGVTSHDKVGDTTLHNGTTYTRYTTITAAASSGTLVAELGDGVFTQDLTFRVWLEGEDDQTVNAIIGGVFSVNIALYALEII